MFILLLCVIYVLFAYYVKTGKNKNSSNNIPMCPGALPFIGHIYLFRGDHCKLLKSLQNLVHCTISVGGISTLKFGPKLVYVITDPDDCLTVANSCLNKAYFYEFGKPWLGNGLITGSAAHWKEGKKLINPGFNINVLNGLVTIFNEKSRNLVKKLENYGGLGPVDIYHIIGFTSLEMISLSAMGFDVRKIIEAGSDKLLMDTLFEAGTKNNVTNEEIRDHVDTMIVSGHETIASAVLFILTLIAAQPNVQVKIHEEFQEVFRDTNRDVDKEDLNNLTYLDAVIKETLRLYPIGPFVLRKIDKEIILKNHSLKVGTTAVIPVYGLGRHPMWGKDAHEFRPERFLDGSAPVHPATFAAFSIGRRGCVGKVYAMMSMKIMLVHILRNFRVSKPEEELVLKFDVVVKPFSGHKISLEKILT